ncbi:MAG TPA: hypothetical protein VK671_10775 [Mucilaginibacter sp.]|nr:hypothetical protein [Mucilaginibacter sp.]
MNTMILLNIFLIIHLTGLALMAGTTVVDTVAFRFFSKSLEKERERSLNLLELMGKLEALLGIGAALLIISGTGMMIITHGAFAHQIWFKIKLTLILTLILNGFIVGGRQKSKLDASIHKNSPDFDIQTKQAVRNIKTFYLVQLGLFLTIILLSVFKFS